MFFKPNQKIRFFEDSTPFHGVAIVIGEYEDPIRELIVLKLLSTRYAGRGKDESFAEVYQDRGGDDPQVIDFNSYNEGIRVCVVDREELDRRTIVEVYETGVPVKAEMTKGSPGNYFRLRA